MAVLVHMMPLTNHQKLATLSVRFELKLFQCETSKVKSRNELVK